MNGSYSSPWHAPRVRVGNGISRWWFSLVIGDLVPKMHDAIYRRSRAVQQPDQTVTFCRMDGTEDEL